MTEATSTVSSQLAGRVAIVTGAGRGIGRGIAMELAAHGVNVALNDVDAEPVESVQEDIEEQTEAASETFPADVSDSDEVATLFENVQARFNGLDILVNNAGVLRRHESLTDIDDGDWNIVMNVNVKGVFNCTREAVEIMKNQRSGSIVNISSSAGRSTSELGDAAYTASKAAVLGLTRHTAREVAPYDVNVNAICPGLIDTPMVRQATSEEELAAWLDEIPMARLGGPREVGQLAVFLASDGSSYINGSTIDITGASLLI